ncbi:MAG: cellulose synthase [bacterium]|nr:cellulose synthase [bacterium]
MRDTLQSWTFSTNDKHSAMSSSERKEYFTILVGVFAANIFFWSWWFQPEHIGNSFLFALISIPFFYYATLLPGVYTFFVGMMKVPNYKAPEKDKKVALITLTVPGSESINILERQFVAMSQVKYHHDNWILVDKCHSPEIKVLAEKHGLKYFCRHDVSTWGEAQIQKWNDPNPPFKAKTKAGNVNAWLDSFGDNYEVFVQFDIDHRPIPDYLHYTLGYFRDPKVAWVQAPSVYDNLDIWTARGSSEQELVLQGPLQSGFYGFSDTPFIIGSHCTYRMSAIKEIGGFQPTRAEDHLDTVFLAARGYKGVFVNEVIAVGDGPETFETYLAQQFAWAYSMIQVLFQYTPHMIKHYTPKQALQFLFAQTWYTLWCTTMLILFSLPILALSINTNITNIEFLDFMLHLAPMNFAIFIMWYWSRKWFQPHGLMLSWRGIVLHIARWPIVFSALIQVILKVQKPYMITQKGLDQGNNRPFAIQAHIPYFILIGISLAACWIFSFKIGRSNAQGNLFFALYGALMLYIVFLTALLTDTMSMIKEGVSWVESLRMRYKPLLIMLSLLMIIVYTGYQVTGRVYESITYNNKINTEVNFKAIASDAWTKTGQVISELTTHQEIN